MKQKLRDIWGYLKARFKTKFLANEVDPVKVRRKQIRFGLLIAGVIVVVLIASNILIEKTDEQSNTMSKSSASNAKSKGSNTGIQDLTKGVENEMLWTQKGQKSIDEMKKSQELTKKDWEKYKTHIDKDKVGKEDLRAYLEKLELRMEKKYEAKLAKQMQEFVQSKSSNGRGSSVDVSEFVKRRKKFRKFPDYIPANSYVEGVVTRGVDQTAGVLDAANPKSAVVRITGMVTSAGFGKKYLKSDKLKGCTIRFATIAEISSEKVYLKGTKMTCAVDEERTVEVFVKATAGAAGKDGVRGAVVSREGDLVFKAFLARFLGDVGGGVADSVGGGINIGTGFTLSDGNSTKDILKRGFGSGLKGGTDTLVDYMVKSLDQYKPVISLNQGTKVTIDFQEGFSLSEEEE